MRERDTVEMTNLIFVLGTNSRKQEIIGNNKKSLILKID